MSSKSSRLESETPAWHARTLERSLEAARHRALDRGRQYIAVAMDLIQTKGMDFTVQDVVDHSKSSLRTFYQHFANRDELLLAVFEEIIQQSAVELRARITAASDQSGLERVHEFVTGLYAMVEVTPSSRPLVVYHLGLAHNWPDEFRIALDPLTVMLTSLVEGAAAEGSFRSDIEPAKLAAFLLQTVVTSLHMSLLGAALDGTPTTGDELWSLCYTGCAGSA
jgi:AcrR family transcriptional regulator